MNGLQTFSWCDDARCRSGQTLDGQLGNGRSCPAGPLDDAGQWSCGSAATMLAGDRATARFNSPAKRMIPMPTHRWEVRSAHSKKGGL